MFKYLRDYNLMFGMFNVYYTSNQWWDRIKKIGNYMKSRK